MIYAPTQDGFGSGGAWHDTEGFISVSGPHPPSIVNAGLRFELNPGVLFDQATLHLEATGFAYAESVPTFHVWLIPGAAPLAWSNGNLPVPAGDVVASRPIPLSDGGPYDFVLDVTKINARAGLAGWAGVIALAMVYDADTSGFRDFYSTRAGQPPVLTTQETPLPAVPGGPPAPDTTLKSLPRPFNRDDFRGVLK